MTKDEALALALEALEKISRTQYHIETPPVESLEEQMRRIADKAITAIKQARSAPVQEPVAWMYPDDYERMLTSETFCTVYSVEVGSPTKGESSVALYTTPPAAQRQWVGLTDDEIDGMVEVTDLSGAYYYDDLHAVARAIEAKLRSKNNG